VEGFVSDSVIRTARSTDEDLALRMAQGDSGAFDTLVHRYEDELYGYLRRYTGNTALAEDVFQNTFLQVWLKSKQFDHGRVFRPWLYTIATNQAIDALRRQNRHSTLSLEESRGDTENGETGRLLEMLTSSEVDPSDAMDWGESQETVRQAVDDLPLNLREVLILAYYQGLKYREIAEILGVPVGTVKSRLHSALLKLQEHLPWEKALKTAAVPSEGV